jgi:anti-sigma B factor antagonist
MGLDPNTGPPFAIIVIPGHPTTVVLKGELDMATAPELAERLKEVAATGQHEVTVDLGELEFMDSQGINVLLHARATLHSQGRGLTIRSPRPLVARVLETTGLLKLLTGEE